MAEERESNPTTPRQVVWEPLPRQSVFIQCPCSDVGFGGARGGGKSWAILGDWIGHEEQYGQHAIGLVLRRERTQLIELIESAKRIFIPLGYTFKDVDKVFVGPKGGRLRFAYLETDSDCDAYQGHSYTRLYIEEAATFPSEGPINKLQATLRSGQGVPCQMKATMNPGGPGHHWCKARYKLDTHPNGMEVFRFEWVNPFTKAKVEKTRVFIPSKVVDNKYLSDDYVASLFQSGSPELVRMWLDGDWSFVLGAFFTEWSSKNICEPFSIPDEWFRFRSIDWGTAKPFSVGWWAVNGDDHPIGGNRVIPRGSLIRYREWYGASGPNVGVRLTAEEVAEGIKARSHDEKISYTVLDRSCFNFQGGPTIAETFFRHGVPCRQADNTRVARAGAMSGWDQMRARIRGDGETPMLYVFSSCHDFIRTVPALQHDRGRAEDVDTDAEDHVADEARYACMSRPWTPARTEITETYYSPSEAIPMKPRSWKVLSEMSYDEFFESIKGGKRQRVRL